MPEQSAALSANTQNPKQSPNKTINWKLIGIIAVIAAIIIGGLGYAAVVFDIFGTKVQKASFSTQPTTKPSKEPVQFKEQIKRFVFTREDGIYSILSDGTKELKLATAGGSQSNIRVPPDFKKVTFVNDWDLWVIGADGKGRKKLVDGRDFTSKYFAVVVVPLSWSPDSNKIAYFLEAKPPGPFFDAPIPPSLKNLKVDQSVNYGLYILDTKTGKKKFLRKGDSEDGPLLDESDPSTGLDYVGWLSNKNVLLFVNLDDLMQGNLILREGGRDFYSINETTGKLDKFAEDTYPGLGFSFDSDISNGEGKIVWSASTHFSSPGPDRSWVSVAKIDGTDRKDISDLGGEMEYQAPLFSPNGQYVVFDRTERIGEDEEKWSVYIYDSSKGETRLLAKDVHSYMWLDDQNILVSDEEEGIYKINIITGKKILVVKNAEAVSY